MVPPTRLVMLPGVFTDRDVRPFDKRRAGSVRTVVTQSGIKSGKNQTRKKWDVVSRKRPTVWLGRFPSEQKWNRGSA